MDILLIIIICIQILCMILIAYALNIYINSLYTIKLENRFKNYTLKNNKPTSTPLFEKIFTYIYKIIHKISQLIKKLEIVKTLSKRYDKYVNNDKNINSSIDLISIKILISLSFSILYLITTIIRGNFSIMLFFLIFIIFFFIVDIYYIIYYKIKRKKIEDDLLNAIIIMNNAFKSGMNITEAINIVALELSGPIKEEFKKINNDIKYGLDFETAFDRFYNRVKIEDIKYISSSLDLINKTGGNIVKVFTSIENNFYDKKKIKNEMNSLTSSSKFMFRMLVSMPIILTILLLSLNQTYFSPLISTVLGRIIISIIIILYIIYIFIIKIVMKVEYHE